MRASEPRLRPLSADEWDDDVRQLLGGTTGVGDGRVLNIFATLAHHPKLVKRWTVFGNHVLFKSTLPERERELVILRVGWRAQAEYEWGQHVVIARRCGVTDEEIEWVKLGPDAIGWSPFDATLLRAELHTGRPHQIRVHAQGAGHSVVGDEKYASEKELAADRGLRIQRLCLHAQYLRIATSEGVQAFESPLPRDFKAAWNKFS